MKPVCATLVAILSLAACNTTLTGYPFTTLAIYEAPVSQLRITINAEGFVPAGSDVSETSGGTVLITTITETGKQVLFTFGDDDEVTYAINEIDSGIARWDWRDAGQSLENILAAAEYSTADENEMVEIISVIGGAFGGPKTVTLDGQAEFLKVVKVDSRP